MSKIVDLFRKSKPVQNTDVKYSALLEQLIKPFEDEFIDEEYYEDIFEFAMNAWNIANMKLLMPEGEIEKAINSVDSLDSDIDLLERMVNYKINHFKEHTRFIVSFEINEINNESVLTVATQEEDAFLANMFEQMEAENHIGEYEENYINRTAIIIKPLQPFIDWYSNLYPDDIVEIKETNIYLIHENIENTEAWIKKNYSKIFDFELESWHLNKKEWPQKRNYKMFREWFQTDISVEVYDFEKEPVSKSEFNSPL